MRPRPTWFSTPKAFVSSWILLLSPLVPAACSIDADASNCQVLATCCTSLTGEAATACSAAVASGSEGNCDTELGALATAGECGGATSPDASSPGSPTAPDVSQTKTCDQYVECMGAVDPASQATILAAYGPDGSCWTSAATSAECNSACAGGLAAARVTEANLAACGPCATDADCPSTAPYCNVDGTCADNTFGTPNGSGDGSSDGGVFLGIDGGGDSDSCYAGSGISGGTSDFALTVDDTGFSQSMLSTAGDSKATITLKNVGTKPHGFSVSCDVTVTGGNSAGCPAPPCFPNSSTITPLMPGESITITFETPSASGLIYEWGSNEPADVNVAGLNGLQWSLM